MATTMCVSITPYWEQFIKDCVERGGFVSQSEVVREALRHFEKTHPAAKADYRQPVGTGK